MKLLIITLLFLGSCASGKVQEKTIVDFKQDSYYFKTTNLTQLEQFVVDFRNSPLGTKIQVNGHTSDRERSRNLAFRRAMATKSVLVDMGIDPAVIETRTKENRNGSYASLRLDPPSKPRRVVPTPSTFQ